MKYFAMIDLFYVDHYTERTAENKMKFRLAVMHANCATGMYQPNWTVYDVLADKILPGQGLNYV